MFSVSFEGIEDGESFYDTFCSGELSTGPMLSKRDGFETILSPPTVKRAESEPVRRNFPPAVVEHDSGEVAGYFLDDDETAVLSMSGFQGGGDLTGFSETIEDFLAACAKEGKSKLIIDVTSNGGGAIFLGYDVFKQVSTDGFSLKHFLSTLTFGPPALPRGTHHRCVQLPLQ